MQLELTWFFQLFAYLSSQFFFSRHCHYTYLTFHIFPHIYASIILIFVPFPKKNQTELVASKHPKRTGQDVGLLTLSESSRFRPVRTPSVPLNILARRRRRNGTETWRRRPCHCENNHLNTHEKILLKGHVPRRTGNVTYSLNQS